jgi:hypothetical protein
VSTRQQEHRHTKGTNTRDDEDRHSFEYSLSKHNKGRNTKWNMKTKQNDIGQKDPEHSRCRAEKKKKNYSEERGYR